MKVFSEIIIVLPFVSLKIIVENNYSDISVVGLERLHNKGKAERTSDHLIVYVFNIGKEMNSQAAVLAFSFENEPGSI